MKEEKAACHDVKDAAIEYKTTSYNIGETNQWPSYLLKIIWTSGHLEKAKNS